jgi:predicted secreted protein
MLRNKKIIFTAHCVLNQNSVIKDWERSTSSFKTIIDLIIKEDISIIQLPCPELKHLGLNRPPLSKEDYDNLEYRQLCSQLAENIVEEILVYKKENYRIIGLIGIQESPTCDTNGQKGIFMEELFKQLSLNDLDLRTFDIPEEYSERKNFSLKNEFVNFLKGYSK